MIILVKCVDFIFVDLKVKDKISYFYIFPLQLTIYSSGVSTGEMRRSYPPVHKTTKVEL